MFHKNTDNITLAIVTRNRAKDLTKCLLSIKRQRLKPKQVIIINNNSSDNTQQIINHFKKKLNLSSYNQEKIGFSYARNAALKKCSSPWLVFIDDDCVLPKNWFLEVTKSVSLLGNKYAAILGKSYNIFPTNIFACISQYGRELWFTENIAKQKILDYKVLDTRNLILNINLLKNFKINFDESLKYGGEDSDLGRKIKKNKLLATYSPNFYLFHKEPTTFNKLIQQKTKYSKSKIPSRTNRKISKFEKLIIFNKTTQKLNLTQKLKFIFFFFRAKFLI